MSPQLIRYFIVGASSYLIEMLTLYLLVHLFKLSSLYSVSISFWVGLIVAFFMQKIITFRSYQKKTSIVLRQIIEYGGLVLFNYIFSLLMVYVAQKYLSVYIIRSLVIVICTCWNYLFYKIIFRSNE